MVKLSNKPNIKGIKNAAQDTRYKSQMIGREGRLFAGVLATRITGMTYGIILAFVLIVLIPFLVKAIGI